MVDLIFLFTNLRRIFGSWFGVLSILEDIKEVLIFVLDSNFASCSLGGCLLAHVSFWWN
jgi:hypothetical protein